MHYLITLYNLYILNFIKSSRIENLMKNSGDSSEQLNCLNEKLLIVEM